MSFDEILTALEEQYNKNEVLYVSDLAKYYAEDSDEFDKLMTELEKKNVVVSNDPSSEEPEIDDLGEIDLKDVEEVDVSNYDELPESLKVDDPVRMYLKEIGKIPLLTMEQETKYSEDVVAGRAAQEELNKIEADENNTVSLEEYEKLLDIVDKAAEAKDCLVNANLRLVVSIAKKYLSRGLQFLDLIQEGNLGLIKAVDKFDYKKGFKFSTYATWWIRQAITRAVADQARTIRIPVHMVETINKLVRIQRQLVQELSREPTPEEVAERMEISVEKVQQIQRIAQEPISLESTCFRSI